MRPPQRTDPDKKQRSCAQKGGKATQESRAARSLKHVSFLTPPVFDPSKAFLDPKDSATRHLPAPPGLTALLNDEQHPSQSAQRTIDLLTKHGEE